MQGTKIVFQVEAVWWCLDCRTVWPSDALAPMGPGVLMHNIAKCPSGHIARLTTEDGVTVDTLRTDNNELRAYKAAHPAPSRDRRPPDKSRRSK